ncbi:uncharacterized protein ACR2FA_005603 [Aphomia sociella]
MILKVCGTLFILIVTECYGRPFTVVSNLGASAEAGYNVRGSAGYDTASRDNGFEVIAGTNGRMGIGAGYGVGQVGRNGDYGGNGLAVAGKLKGRAGGIGTTGIKGRFGKKLWHSTGQASGEIAGNLDADKGIYISPPNGIYDPWNHLNNYGNCQDHNTLRVAIGLRLGAAICTPHVCPCGAEVDQLRHQGLSCSKSAGHFSRHASLNESVDLLSPLTY